MGVGEEVSVTPVVGDVFIRFEDFPAEVLKLMGGALRFQALAHGNDKGCGAFLGKFLIFFKLDVFLSVGFALPFFRCIG